MINLSCTYFFRIAQDPAIVIDFEDYLPAIRGKEADAFIKWSDPSLVPEDQEPGTGDYMVGYVWPDNKTVFPDFLRPETQEWWSNEIKLFHEVSRDTTCPCTYT